MDKLNVDSEMVTLDQNFPNPFQGKTVISYSLPTEVNKAQLVIANLQGVIVKRSDLNVQKNAIEISAEDINPGVYTYLIIYDGKRSKVKKMTFIQ